MAGFSRLSCHLLTCKPTMPYYMRRPLKPTLTYALPPHNLALQSEKWVVSKSHWSQQSVIFRAPVLRAYLSCGMPFLTYHLGDIRPLLPCEISPLGQAPHFSCHVIKVSGSYSIYAAPCPRRHGALAEQVNSRSPDRRFKPSHFDLEDADPCMNI